MEMSNHENRLASWLHLAILLLLLCALTTMGVRAQHQAAATASDHASLNQLADHSKAVPFYISALIIDWALFFYCYVGVRWNGGTLATLIGGRWGSVKEIFTDVLIAVSFWLVFEGSAYGVHFLLDRFFPEVSTASIQALLPQSAVEACLWIVLCCSAGICEEAVYRGYLQKQLHALTGSLTVAVVLQGAIFGVSHGYQGWKSVTVISILGMLYGLLAVWRKNLRANILSHAWSDLWEGWLQFVVFK